MQPIIDTSKNKELAVSRLLICIPLLRERPVLWCVHKSKALADTFVVITPATEQCFL